MVLIQLLKMTSVIEIKTACLCLYWFLFLVNNPYHLLVLQEDVLYRKRCSMHGASKNKSVHSVMLGGNLTNDYQSEPVMREARCALACSLLSLRKKCGAFWSRSNFAEDLTMPAQKELIILKAK